MGTYYRLPVEIFKSRLDNEIIHKLFSEGWAQSLAAPVSTDERLKSLQMIDLAERAEKMSHTSAPFQRPKGLTKDKDKDSEMTTAAKYARISAETQLHDMMTSVIKNSLFG